MKTILLLSILLCAIAMPAIGELSKADLDQIRLIIVDSEKRVKEEIKKDITASETQMKEYIDLKISTLKTPIAWLIGILIAIIALIGLPLAILTIFLGWRSVRDTSLQQQIDAFAKAIESQNELETTIEQLTQEIETLKQQRIVNL